MSINLSDLTSPNNQDVLAEITSGADFLDPIGKLENLSRGSTAGGHALQTVALNQPRALPLIKNPAGDLGGYLYIPNVTGNYAEGPSVTIGANQTWEGELDMVITQFGNFIQPMGGGFYSTGFGLIFYSNEKVSLMSKAVAGGEGNSDVTVGTPFNVKYGYDGTDVYVDIDGVRKFSNTAPSQAASITHNLQLSQQNNLSYSGNYAIQKAKLTVNNAVVFDCDFNGSTSIRHGDTKLQASVGGPVSLTRAGQDPITVVKKDILRFDGVNDFMNGLLNQTVTGGYMFAAFSVLGDGGSSFARILGLNSSGSVDSGPGGVAFRRFGTSQDWMIRYNENNITGQSDFFDDERGDYLLEAKVLTNSQKSKINNADEKTSSVTGQLSVEEFTVGSYTNANASFIAVDLEFLALFPATITDDQADSVRNYINNRNNVFDLKDGFGYYFFDAQKAPVGAISSGSSAWNGRIVGSDNGDTNRYATQSTANHQPVSDGFKVTFADNTDHLDIPSITQAGWQIVGTSLGTFAYRVNANEQIRLNLLGYRGHPNFRKTGDLYGIMLLPESATSADVNAARKLLIDRGASDAAYAGSLGQAWYNRLDIVEFGHIDCSAVTSAAYTWYQNINLSTFPALDLSNSTSFTNAWKFCSSLQQFPSGAKLGTEASNVDFSSAWQSSGLTSFSTPLPTATSLRKAFNSCTSLVSFESELPEATRVDLAWFGNTSLSDFKTTDIKNCTNFTSSWQGTSALTSFQAGAKLGTAASNVNFTSAFQSSGLTSFPALDLSNGNNFFNAFQGCSSLTTIENGILLGTAVTAANVNFHSAFLGSGISSLP